MAFGECCKVTEQSHALRNSQGFGILEDRLKSSAGVKDAIVAGLAIIGIGPRRTAFSADEPDRFGFLAHQRTLACLLRQSWISNTNGNVPDLIGLIRRSLRAVRKEALLGKLQIGVARFAMQARCDQRNTGLVEKSGERAGDIGIRTTERSQKLRRSSVAP